MPATANHRAKLKRTVQDTAAKSLSAYSAKRLFDTTPEPLPAATVGRNGPLLFVVQQHAARRLHYDFRLELDGVLKSWAIPKGPSFDPHVRRLAIQTEDHPFDYASFEGVIPPKQYGAGEVLIWDCGVYSPDEHGTYWYHDRRVAEQRVRAALEKGHLRLFLRGHKLKGEFDLVRGADSKNWLLIKHRDRFASDEIAEANAELNYSVVSGMTLEDLKTRPAREPMAARHLTVAGVTEAMPSKLSPMLAQLGQAPFSHPDWLFEPKLDGYRILAFVDEKKVRLQSRNGLDLSQSFPQICAELAAQTVTGIILDGEIMAFGADGKPSFNALQNRVQLMTARERDADDLTQLVFYCFDLLHFAGLNLRQVPYDDRRRYLSQCLLPSAHVRLIDASEDGEALYQAALANGLEGVVAKKRDSKYQAGRRSASWLKIKFTHSAEFVIAGYTSGRGARAPLGALLLGYWMQGKLRYAGHVGTGLDDATLAQLRQRFESLRSDALPFAEAPPLHRNTTWLRPELVAEVKFAEWTPDGYLRAPVFLRLREDIDARTLRRTPATQTCSTIHVGALPPSDPVREVLHQLEEDKANLTITVGEHRIRLTHLDRIYWPADASLQQPALTKRDLLRYLAQVSPFMLPHLADRPLTMLRMPEGINGPRFFQKHWQHEVPEFASTVTVFSESKDARQTYLVCNNLPTLLWLAQAGTLEFHVWHSRARRDARTKNRGTDYASSLETLQSSVLNYPDYLVFDIDPYIYSGKEAAGAEPEYNTAAFDQAKEVAFWLRDLLLAMAIEPFVKTSGKTGLHVMVPIERTLDFAAVREICAIVSSHLRQQHAKVITMEWSTDKRTGKMFMDCNMNTRSKTLNAAYSTRVLPGAPVSTPLTWEELTQAHPLDFRLTSITERLQQTGDPWHGILARKQDLKRTLGQG